MGRIREHIISVVSKQVDEAAIIVWYDPDRAYSDLVGQLDLPNTDVLIYDGSFFELRASIEPFLEFVGPSGKPEEERPGRRVVVYVPLARSDTSRALIEAECAGRVLEPGASAWQRNTRLRVIVERIFRELSPERAGEIARRAEDGALTIDDLDHLADEAGDSEAGLLRLIYGPASLPEIILAFVASQEHDAEIESKKALVELTKLLASSLGIDLGTAGGDLVAARSALARTLLLRDLISAVSGQGGTIGELTQISGSASQTDLRAAARICEMWRNRADYAEAYVKAARSVEAEAGVAAFELKAEWITEAHTFPSLESRLLTHAKQLILDGLPDKALTLCEQRRASFWSRHEPTNQLHWAVVETAGRVVATAARIALSLKALPRDPAALTRAYTEDAEPWCLLDTYSRSLEHQLSRFDLEGELAREEERDLLDQVAEAARRGYAETVDACALAFTTAIERADFDPEPVLRQREVFGRLLKPLLAEADTAGRKIAYVLVDAMCFEMGRELATGLEEQFEATLTPVFAQPPTITPVGMAALLPGAGKEMELVDAGRGTVAVKIGDAMLKDRAARVQYLKEALGYEMADIKLDDLIRPKKAVKDGVRKAKLVLVTSQEIDRWGEAAAGEDEARWVMPQVLDKLRRGVRTLAALGVTDILLVADHGHLRANVIESGMKIDAPGGNTVDLHRRVWIGKGGASGEGYLRVPASVVGLGGELELAFPRTLACFKASGPSTFFHGGISLQECIIPALLLRPKTFPGAAAKPGTVTITMDRTMITTRFLSITATYSRAELFDGETKRVRFTVRAGTKDVGESVAAAYGFEEATGEVIVRHNQPNVVTLRLTEDPATDTVSILAIDPTTQVELGSKQAIPVKLSL